MVKINGRNIIAGKKSKQSNNFFNSFNPTISEKSETKFAEANKKEIDKAIISAYKNFKKTDLDTEKKAVFLEKLSEEIMNLGEQLIELGIWETALSKERLIGERKRTCDQLKKFAEYIREGSYVEATINTGDPDVRRMLIPIGPVAVFEASNFPFAFGVCGGDSASAWAAGCPVILKAHPSHPMTSELFAKAVNKTIDKQNIPKGFFSLLHGRSKKVGKQIVLHPKIEAVAFTGSLQGGRALYDLASSRTKPIPVYAEMGSINPVFITSKTLKKNTDDIAKKIADSATKGTGQFCTKPGVIFLPSNGDRFIQKIVEIFKEKETGFLIHKKTKKTLVKQIQETTSISDVKIVEGGTPIENKTMFKNTVIVTNAETFLEEKKLHQEHFGPVIILVKCKQEEQFFEIVEKLEGQLTATVFCKQETDRVKKMMKRLTNKVGRIIINGVPTGVRVCQAMQHGGPYPATTDIRSTSVGMNAIKRFLKPIAFQDTPEFLLPDELKKDNKKNILRTVNGEYRR
ncbi:MAG: aldehyde dehydrogenase (NADP(+)) [Candidatus Thermoplasmatota archaeon]